MNVLETGFWEGVVIEAPGAGVTLNLSPVGKVKTRLLPLMVYSVISASPNRTT